MKLTDAITKFLAHLTAAGRSATTVSAYRGDLRQFVDMFRQDNDAALENVIAVTPSDIETFLDGFTAATRARKYSVIYNLFGFLYAERLVLDNPAAEVARDTPKRAILQRVPTESDIRRVVESAAHGTRNRAILELLAMGLSPSEVAALDVEDYAAEAGTIRSQSGTQGRERTVALSTTAICALDAYMATGRGEPAYRANTVLFPSKYGTRMTRLGIWKVASIHCPAGVTLSPRDLKRARTVALIAQGMGREAVADQMGHANLVTTRHYEHLAKRMKRSA